LKIKRIIVRSHNIAVREGEDIWWDVIFTSSYQWRRATTRHKEACLIKQTKLFAFTSLFKKKKWTKSVNRVAEVPVATGGTGWVSVATGGTGWCVGRGFQIACRQTCHYVCQEIHASLSIYVLVCLLIFNWIFQKWGATHPRLIQPPTRDPFCVMDDGTISGAPQESVFVLLC
jgi:hypothetical protein